MKNLLTATLPALGLLALGGCATSGALTSTTESDGIYYSSADKTTAANSLNTAYTNRAVAASPNPDGYAYNQQAPATTAPASTDENANPDYYDGTVANNGIQGANGDYYVTNSYNPSSFGVPYTGPGVSYANYAPVTVAAYGSPYGYGGFGYPAYGGFYSPYAYSAFYDPFYSPWGYGGYGSGFSIGFGYGGWGSPYYGGFYGSRWGYGYPGYGRYSYYGDPYGYGGYGGYGYGYGYGGYGSGYNRPVIYANGTRSGTGDNPILVGPRGGRGGSVLSGGRNGVASPGTNPIDIGRRNGGTFSTGGLAPAGGQADAALGNRAGRAATNFGGGQTVAAPAPGTNGMAGAGQPAAQAENRRGFFNGFFGGNGARPEGQGQATGMDRSSMGGSGRSMSEGQSGMSRREYSQPSFNNGGQPQRRDFGGQQQQQRSFSPPQQQQRSFEQRSFSQPSYSQPSPSRSFGGGNGGGGGNFGGGGGGGNFGGGGGGGRRP